MPDTPQSVGSVVAGGQRSTAADGQPRAHDLATRLRRAMKAVDVSERPIRQVVPVSDVGDRYYLRLGTWGLDDVETLVELLEGRAPFIGRRDGSPSLPGTPT